jgi:hypothetical protein
MLMREERIRELAEKLLQESGNTVDIVEKTLRVRKVDLR